jgi:hypothetical protein
MRSADMQPIKLLVILILGASVLSSCATNGVSSKSNMQMAQAQYSPPVNYASRLPSHLATNGRKTILIDPNVHAWGAYGSDGDLIKAGLATAGNSWCPDIKRACRTRAGSFQIGSLGNASCKSSIYPLPRGGAPMPYCMFFNGNQGLHGSYQVVEGNVSHGCVRVQVSDAEWIRYNFANIGTRVIVKSY